MSKRLWSWVSQPKSALAAEPEQLPTSGDHPLAQRRLLKAMEAERETYGAVVVVPALFPSAAADT